ncbi:MAG: ThuA domain-containing protein [Thermoguttaceae bacterium]
MAIRRLWLAAVLLLAASLLAGTAAADGPKQKLNAVLWVGGHSHDFKAYGEILGEALPKLIAIDITVVRDGAFLDAAEVGKLDVILMNHCFDSDRGVLNDAQKQKLLELVRGGVGVVGIHASYYSFVKWDDFRELFGTRFIKHGSSNVFVTVRITNDQHPITRGVPSSFEVKSELYESKPLAEDCRVLAVAKEKGKDRELPSVWTRDFGKGKVVTILPAHWPEAYRVDAFQKLIANSTVWAARQAPTR